MGGYTDAPAVDVRGFHVFAGATPVLEVEDRPGTLHSTAPPPPGGPPAHPFVHGVALDPASEHELGGLLRSASDFDAFVEALVVAGYDLVAADGSVRNRHGAPARVLDGQRPVGSLWPGGGRFSCLWWMPAEGHLVFVHATATAYHHEHAEALYAAVAEAGSFPAVCAAVEARGLTVTATR